MRNTKGGRLDVLITREETMMYTTDERKTMIAINRVQAAMGEVAIEFNGLNPDQRFPKKIER